MKADIFLISKAFIILLIMLFSFCYNYLVLPFSIKNPILKSNNNLITASEYLQYIKNSLIATKFYIGTPEKEIEIYLTMDRYDFILGEGFCIKNSNSYYNPSFSSTFEKDAMTVFGPLYTNATMSKDNFLFFNTINLTQNNTIDKINFIYGKASSNIFEINDPNTCCGYFGLQSTLGIDYFEYHSLIYQLKSNRNINNKYWSVIFYDNDKSKIRNNDGIIVLGLTENDYKTIFNINDDDNSYNKTYSPEYGYKTKNWEIKFNEIYYYINNKNYSFFSNIQGQLIIDYNFIMCNSDYFNSIITNFFNKYINEGICYIDKNETIKKFSQKDTQLINVIICNKNKFKDIKKFPTLYFKHIDLNKIFEFNYKDLFQEFGNSLIFSIVLDEENKSHWAFGRIFFKKYQIIFDNDQKTYTYIKSSDIINNETSKESKENYKIIILKIMVIAFLLIGFGAGLFLGKKLWDKNRKKRANELEEDYEYVNGNNVKEDSKKNGLYEDK